MKEFGLKRKLFGGYKTYLHLYMYLSVIQKVQWDLVRISEPPKVDSTTSEAAAT